MEITTKFNVNDLTQRKWDRSPENKLFALEIMEIISQSCYAGTQVFYLCRQIQMFKSFKEKYKEEGDFKWVVAHGITNEEGEMGWIKYREDELIPAPKESLEILHNASQ